MLVLFADITAMSLQLLVEGESFITTGAEELKFLCVTSVVLGQVPNISAHVIALVA